MSEARPSAAHLTPDELSRLVMNRARRRRSEPSRSGLEIPRRPPGATAPVSFAQRRLWLLDRLDPGNPSYNIPYAAALKGPLEARWLAAGLAEIVRRHESLRTRFAAGDDEPVQVVEPPRPGTPLPAVDLSALPAPAAEAEALRLQAADAATPFDLARAPLFRAVLLRLERRSHHLLLNLHHSISDGWSYSVLLDELSALYGDLAAGRPSSLPPLPIQYADFAAWQRRRLEGEVLEEQLAYWRRQLAGAPPLLELPTDRPRPALQTHHGDAVHHRLPAALGDGLRRLARRQDATLFMLLLALFQLLLGRLAGQRDVVVGAPSAGRGRVETEKLIGFFLNSLVLRADLGANPTLSELVARVREGVLGAFRYQEVPFEKLLDELGAERVLSSSPLFQVQLNMLALPELALRLQGLEVEEIGDRVSFAKLDLNLYVTDGEKGLDLSLVYNADLFDRPRMVELLRQLEELARQAVEDPHRRIEELSLRTPAAAARLPPRGRPQGGPRRDVGPGAVHRRLAFHGARTPERTAVADEDETLTYGELAARSRRLARRLRQAGVARGGVVAVWCHRGAPLVEAVYGVLEAGGAFLLLDPAYPAGRLATYLEIARPAAWIELSAAGPPPGEVTATLERSGCHARLTLPAAVLEADDDETVAGPEVGPDVGPEDAACLTFTSGSTGEPKGVVGRHGPLTAFQPGWAQRFGLTAEDRFGMLSALAHDPLQRDLFTPLWLGARLEIPHPDRIGAPGRLAAWLAGRRITVFHLTPAMMELLAADAGVGGDDDRSAAPEDPSAARDAARDVALRRAFVVGELLKRRQVARLLAAAPAAEVINLYGATETQRAVSVHRVAPPAGGPGREALPLGRGIDGVDLLVVGRSGGPAGVGELGEVLVRSRHLARGYLDDPRLTARRFLPDPFAGSGADAPRAGGERVYRTGDLGRYLPDGEVEFAGRADQQVKLRGFRIELGEVESALASHPAVTVAAAVVVEAGGGPRLAAYYVPAPGAAPAGDLHAFLAARLPLYMVPAALVPLPALPLTRNGKVDRRALPAPDFGSAGPAGGHVAPRTPVEEEVAAIWRRCLGVERVGMTDGFFELGGHSLLAIQVLAAVKESFGVELPLRLLFESPTAEAMAVAIVEERARRVEDEELAGLLAEVEGLSESELDALLAGEGLVPETRSPR